MTGESRPSTTPACWPHWRVKRWRTHTIPKAAEGLAARSSATQPMSVGGSGDNSCVSTGQPSTGDSRLPRSKLRSLRSRWCTPRRRVSGVALFESKVSPCHFRAHHRFHKSYGDGAVCLTSDDFKGLRFGVVVISTRVSLEKTTSCPRASQRS
jgi:hypothetical protein